MLFMFVGKRLHDHVRVLAYKSIQDTSLVTTTRTWCALRTRWIHGASWCALVVAHAALGVGAILPTLVTARCVVEEAPIHDDTSELLHMHDVNRRLVRGSTDRLIE